MKRKLRAGLIMMLCVSVALAFGVLPQKAYAGLDKDTYTFTKDTTLWVKTTAGETISAVTKSPDTGSQDPAYAVLEGSKYFKIYPYSFGTCTFTALDENGKIIGTVKVTVTEEALDDIFKWENAVHSVFPYGEKYLIIGADKRWEGTEYDLNIDGDSYTGTIDSTGKVQLDRIYPFGTIVTGKLKGYRSGVAAMYEFPTSGEWALTCFCDVHVRATAKGKNKKKVKIYATNVHNGDVVKVKYAGKTYSKKVTKNFTDKTMTYTVKMKKKMKNNKWLKFRVTNKFKQEIYSFDTKMRLWDSDKWFPPDE
ncbi:MAG: hypothetical protein IJI74_07540 [Firmicutes bacterium]|nr:hypothetical protein [Bacillota bacterium]